MSSNVHTALSRNDWPLDLVYDLPSQSLQGDPSIDDPANDTGLGPRCDAFEVDGDFTIRRVTRPETLSLTVSGKGTGSGTIKGTMAIVRKPRLPRRELWGMVGEERGQPNDRQWFVRRKPFADPLKMEIQ